MEVRHEYDRNGPRRSGRDLTCTVEGSGHRDEQEVTESSLWFGKTFEWGEGVEDCVRGR